LCPWPSSFHKADIPRHCLLDSLANLMSGSIAQQASCLTHISLRMTHITSTKIPIVRLFLITNPVNSKTSLYLLKQLVQRCSVTNRDIIYLIFGLFCGSRCSQ